MERFMVLGLVPVLMQSQAPAVKKSLDPIQDEAGLLKAMHEEFNLDIRLHEPIRVTETEDPALIVSLRCVQGMLTNDEFFDRYWKVVSRYKDVSKVKRVIIRVILPFDGGELGSTREWRTDGSGEWKRQSVRK